MIGSSCAKKHFISERGMVKAAWVWRWAFPRELPPENTDIVSFRASSQTGVGIPRINAITFPMGLPHQCAHWFAMTGAK